MNKNKKISQDIKLLGIGITLLIAVIMIVIFSFIFLINNVLPAITTGDEATDVEEIHFDIKGFEELGL